MMAVGRRAVLGGAGVMLAGARRVPLIEAQTAWVDPPAQAAARSGVAVLGDARLAYWDTGGSGEPVVLLHPATGSAAIWVYQQPVFAAAGYRVIGYSRRGFGASSAAPRPGQGSATADLQGLADFLKLGRFHLLGSAAGGFTVADTVVRHPERLRSFVLANSVVGVDDAALRQTAQDLTPETFARLPASVRELGPSYRAGNPAGVAAWTALEQAAHPGGGPGPGVGLGRPPGPPAGGVTWDALAASRVPGLMLTGDADWYLPPAQLRVFGAHLPRLELAVIAEAGHSAYWEQPVAFNRLVLDFFRRHRSG